MNVQFITQFEPAIDLMVLVLQVPVGVEEIDIPLLVPAAIKTAILAVAKKADFKAKTMHFFTFDYEPLKRIVVGFVETKTKKFAELTLLRKMLAAGASNNPELILFHSSIRMPDLTDTFASALEAKNFAFAKYAAQPAPVKNMPKILLLGAKEESDENVLKFHHAAAVTKGTNLVRNLGMRSGNDLDCKNYVSYVHEFAGSAKLDCEIFDFKKLKKMNAGAFLAVAQGSPHEDYAIVKITYRPKGIKDLKLFSLVGKGVVFDTGGTNLKPAGSMFGMHGDMAGSAVVLALLGLAAQEKWQCQIEGWLAISDNAIGPRSFRQNDVVTALNGKTIEIVHTDAEGRMMLADTLTLASRSKPDLILDFATLTGACVGAISSTYAGVFSNRSEFYSTAIKLGQDCGERVWPFPMDDDFFECLESEVADVKQCRLKGGVDHIEAAVFLKQFLAFDIPWLHIDLSAAENDGGLAHVGTKSTGFGVRFGAAFLQTFLDGEL